MSVRLLSSAVIAAAVVVLGASDAVAQSPPVPTHGAPARGSDEAEALQKQGNDLAKKGNWEGARAKYKAAYQISKTYKITGNLGLAEVESGMYRDAATHLSEALQFFPTVVDDTLRAQREQLEQALAAAKEHLVTVTVDVSEPNAEIAADGVVVGKSPLARPLFYDPGGAHTVSARLDGYLPNQAKVEGSAGNSQHVVLALARDTASAAPKAEPKPEAPPQSPSSGRAFHPALFSIPLVAAGVGIGAGTYLRSAAYGQLSNLIDNQYFYVTHGFGNSVNCDASSPLTVCQYINSNKQSFDRASAGAEASFGLAAGMLAVTGVMLAVEARNDDPARRPFHPGWFAAPLVVGTVALSAAAGLHAASAKHGAQMADGAVGIYRRSGAAGCDDPASNADCQANLSVANASDTEGNAALGMAIVGGIATVATGIMVGAYFGLGANKPSDDKAAAGPPIIIAPRLGANDRGVNIGGVW